MKDFQPLKQKILNSQHYIHAVCYFLFLIFIAIGLLDLSLKYKLLQNRILKPGFNISMPSQYPVYQSFFKTSPFLLNISANAFLVMDKDSKVALFKKNPDLRFSMASTTKIMTALVALEYYKMNDVLTIKTENVEGVNVGFEKDEKVIFEDLLYAMLLPSGNDAATAISENYPGGEEAFIKEMNKNSVSLKLLNTHFGDSTGLDDFSNYTTALDLARLSSIAISDKTFSKIVSTKYKTIQDMEGKKTYSLINLNKLLGAYGVNGVKTGFTEDAWGVLVTSRVENGKTLIIVVMKSEDRFLDTEKLISLISGNIKYMQFNY